MSKWHMRVHTAKKQKIYQQSREKFVIRIICSQQEKQFKTQGTHKLHFKVQERTQSYNFSMKEQSYFDDFLLCFKLIQKLYNCFCTWDFKECIFKIPIVHIHCIEQNRRHSFYLFCSIQLIFFFFGSTFLSCLSRNSLVQQLLQRAYPQSTSKSCNEVEKIVYCMCASFIQGYFDPRTFPIQK